MRLIKQTSLYFKEGNSDKVYVIDLCDVGNEKYVVNFRYGRRDGVLKEGSKTPAPVSLKEAEKLYDVVETDKLNKGYTTSTSGITDKPAKKAFTLDAGKIEIDTRWKTLPASRERAILQRLDDAINGVANNKYEWKLSRIIWKAGACKIKAAAPYIARLFSKGDQLHQYCCAWALARCAGSDPQVVSILDNIYNSHPVGAISKIAGVGLLQNLAGSAKEAHLTQYLNRLPEEFKIVIASGDAIKLKLLLNERVLQQQPGYNWLEDLYLLSIDKRWIRLLLVKILEHVPLRPNYFKHLRAIFKQSELLEDFEMEGLLACRYEREMEMFSSTSVGADDKGEVFIPELEAWVKPLKELKKSNSRLAYSQNTRWYFQSRVLRQLKLNGENNDTAYVKLATALLIGYKYDRDFSKEYSMSNYVWSANQYINQPVKFLQNSRAVFLHSILSGDNPSLVLQSNHMWRQASDHDQANALAKNKTKKNDDPGLGGFIKKLTDFFTKKKPVEQKPEANNAVVRNSLNLDGTPYLHLWNKMPQAYIQLMMDAELEEVHKFAESNLVLHPEYNAIKNKLDKSACIKLLLSPFEIPAAFGYRLALEKYYNVSPDDDLVLAMINSNDEKAVDKGKEWTERYQSAYFQQSTFITALVFAKHQTVRSWSVALLKKAEITSQVKNAVVGKAISELLNLTDQTAVNEPLIKEVGDALFQLFEEELKMLGLAVVADMLQHSNASVLLFGLRLLQAQKYQLDLDKLSKKFIMSLLQHKDAPVRDEGIAILSGMNDEALLSYQEEIIMACLSPYQDIRQGLLPVIKRLAGKEPAFGVVAAERLMPYLLRKEIVAGIHADLSKLLSGELSSYLQNANRETALNLLYSNYNEAQNVGIVILEKYTDASQLSIAQVIALGGHENLNVREFSWKFYKEQSARIKYEKEAAIKLLESKWQDTRVFAMEYFREYFSEDDWSPEILITLSDSVKPDLEAFGRELISKFFTSKNGVLYLLTLSQHPGEKMQLFATNYLERFAADDVAKLSSLDFYFRSILTRVNKSRIAKNRIYHFLLEEGRKSEAAAKIVADILSDISATAAIGDKAKCIEILLQLKALYDVSTPLKIKEMEVRLM